MPQAWKTLKPDEPYQHNWHIDAICDHLEAVSARRDPAPADLGAPSLDEVPDACRSSGPTWEWARDPWLRYWTASYELGLAGRLVGPRPVGDQVPLVPAALGARSSGWSTSRRSTAEQLEGRHAPRDRARIDGPGRARPPDHHRRRRSTPRTPTRPRASSSTARTSGTTRPSWGRGPRRRRRPIVIIMQRLHEDDIAAHAMRMNPGRLDSPLPARALRVRPPVRLARRPPHRGRAALAGPPTATSPPRMDPVARLPPRRRSDPAAPGRARGRHPQALLVALLRPAAVHGRADEVPPAEVLERRPVGRCAAEGQAGRTTGWRSRRGASLAATATCST